MPQIWLAGTVNGVLQMLLVDGGNEVIVNEDNSWPLATIREAHGCRNNDQWAKLNRP